MSALPWTITLMDDHAEIVAADGQVVGTFADPEMARNVVPLPNIRILAKTLCDFLDASKYQGAETIRTMLRMEINRADLRRGNK